jgi:hypothetical protein
MEMHAIDCIAIHSVDDNIDNIPDLQKVGDAFRYCIRRMEE